MRARLVLPALAAALLVLLATADVAAASKTDLEGPGRVMASVAVDLRAADARRWARRNEVLETLTR